MREIIKEMAKMPEFWLSLAAIGCSFAVLIMEWAK